MKLILSKEKLQELEELAAIHLTIKEIALILQVDTLELSTAIFRSGQTAEHKAYHRGKLAEEVEVRKAIFKAAKDGSGPAQTLAIKIIDDNKLHGE